MSLNGDYLEILVDGRLGDRDQPRVFYLFISQTLYCMGAKTQRGKEGNECAFCNLEMNDL